MQTPRHTPPTRRLVALALVAAGAVILLLGILADTIGIGTGKGFGYYQMIILIGGIITGLVGVAMLVHAWTSREPTNDFEPEP